MHYLLSFLLGCCSVAMASGQKDSLRSRSTEVRVPVKDKIYYGIASFYADKFNGRPTANGEIYTHQKLTAACNILPLGTWIRVTNLRNNRSVIVKTNDRLHPRMKRIVDLSKMAAERLGYIGRGLTQVKVEVLERVKKRR